MTDMADSRLPTILVPEPESQTVVVGSRVRVRDADGEYEYAMVARVTIDSPPGCVSIGSPVGRALLGRRRGEQVRAQTPAGVRLLTVVDVAATAAPSCGGSAGQCEP
jgi:transcription elongation GreA/GreB family factor